MSGVSSSSNIQINVDTDETKFRADLALSNSNAVRAIAEEAKVVAEDAEVLSEAAENKSDYAYAAAQASRSISEHVLERIETLENELNCFAQRESNWLSYQVFT